MIKIVEDINDYQNKLVKCEQNIQKIYDMCTSEKKNAYELLETYGLTKRNFAVSHSVILTLEEKINNYLKRAELQSFLISTAESSLNGGLPKYLIDKDELYQLNDDPYALFTLMNIFDEKLVDFEGYSEVIDADLIHNTSKNISLIGNKCMIDIANRVEIMEKADISDYEDDDFIYNFANHALLKAFKELNIHECDYLPSEVRAEIIKSLQIGLNVFDTADIYILFNMASQKLFEINEEAKTLEENNSKKKKKK